MDKFYDSPICLPPLVQTLKNNVHSCISLNPLKKFNWQKQQKVVICRPKFDDVAEDFLQTLCNIDVDYNLLNSLSLNDKVTQLNELLVSTYNNICPPFEKIMNEIDPPWITPKIRKLIKIKNKSKLCKNKNDWISIQNEIKVEIKLAKSKLREKFKEKICNANSSDWYRLVKQVCGLSITSAYDKIVNFSPHYSSLSAKELANEVNHHFSKICNTYTECEQFVLCPFPQNSNPIHVTDTQVSSFIDKLKIKKSNLPDRLPTNYVKLSNCFISPILASIINQSFSSFSFPDAWKIGVITPLLKKVSCSSLNDIRAITQTDLFSKITEEFMFEKLYSILESKINLSQFGCLKKSSTAHYLIKINEFILKSSEIANAKVVLAAIDTFKAFDLIDHTILASLLLHYGVNEVDILWIISFLSYRTQIVKNGSMLSDPEIITCGTPAGTKLAPLLFIVVMNPILDKLESQIVNKYNNFCIASFVDDLVIAERVVNNKPKMQHALDVLHEACIQVKIKPNPSKCEVLIINFGGRKVGFQAEFNINNIKIPVVDSMKILGVYFNSKYNWNLHIDKMSASANSKLFQLRKLHASGFDMNELIRAYTVYIRSNLEYASVVWGPNLSAKLVSKMERVQKRALSIILRKRVDHLNYDDVLNSVKIDTLLIRRNDALERFGYKLMIGRHSYFLPEMLVENSGMKLRKKKVFSQIFIKSDNYFKSSLPTIIRLVNDEFVEKNTIFGHNVDDIIKLRLKFN
jgi:hypothetical protein